MKKNRVPLYDRLPAIYRIKDEEQRPAGQLKHYIALVEDVFHEIHRNIESLYDDLFIETCGEWVIPYIGDLLGTSHLSGKAWNQRADVADTIALRRRKGTINALELLVYNLTGWGVLCRELMNNLVWSQHLNHLRPDRGGISPFSLESCIALHGLDQYKKYLNRWIWIVTDPVDGKTFFTGILKSISGTTISLIREFNTYHIPHDKIKKAFVASYTMNTPVRGGTVPVRDPAQLSLINSPFDPFGHTPDLKPPSMDAIRYNLPNLAVFLWRLKDYRIDLSHPSPLTPGPVHTNSAATGPEAGYIVCFHVHPTGNSIRLFNTQRSNPKNIPPVLSAPDEVPGPIPTARLTEGASAGNPRAYVYCDTYDETASDLETIDISDVGLQFHFPDTNFSDAEWTFRGANLCAWEAGVNPPIRNREIVIDPMIGRFAIGVKTQNEADALLEYLLITHTYGAVGPVGAHPTTRTALSDTWGGDTLKVINVQYKDGKDELKDALNKLNQASYDGYPVMIQIMDSMMYELDLNQVNNALKISEGGLVSLLLKKSLIIRASHGERPVIRLKRQLCFRPKNVKGTTESQQDAYDAEMARLNVRLEGIYFTRDKDWDSRFSNPTETPLIGRAALNRLEMIGCTLDPGGSLKFDGKNRDPIYTSIKLHEPYGFDQADEESAFNQTPEIVVQRSITGPVLINTGYSLVLKDSIIDAGKGVQDDPGNAFAVSNAGSPETKWGPATQVEGITVFGRMRVESLFGKGGIWVHSLDVLNHQIGCIKWSYFSGQGDRLPQNHACVSGKHARLRFTSEIFGQPGYGQLGPTTEFEIRERGPDDDQMGAFGFIKEEHKWRNLKIRFREFMPVGVRPLIITCT